MWNLAQDPLLLDPMRIADELGKAQDVQQVLSVVVGALGVMLVVVVLYHVKREHHWETKYEKRLDKNHRTWGRMEKALALLAGRRASPGLEEDDE